MNPEQKIKIFPNDYQFAGAPKAAKTVSGDATVQRVNAEAGNAHALLLDVNVIQMFVGIVGLGNYLVHTFLCGCFCIS